MLALEEFHPSSVRPVASRHRHARVRSQARRLHNLPTRTTPPTQARASPSILLVLSRIRQRSRHGASPAGSPDPSTSRRTTQTAQQPTLTRPKSERLASREIQMPRLPNGEERVQAQMPIRLSMLRGSPAFRARPKPRLNHWRLFTFPPPLPQPPTRPKKAKVKIFNVPSSRSSPTRPHLHSNLNLNHNHPSALAVKTMIPFDLITTL